MKNKKSHSRAPVIIFVVLLGAAAVALLYGSVAMDLFSGDEGAVASTISADTLATEAPATIPADAVLGPVAITPTEPAEEPATEAATETATEPAVEPAEVFVELPEENNSWALTLVNAANPLPADHAPELAVVGDGYLYDARAVDPLLAMLAGAREAGLSPMICSAYRSIDRQWELYEAKIAELVDYGYTQTDAEATAKTIIAYPGTSEHNLGLATDIVAEYYDTLDRTQADTPEAKWLTAHCAEYGFILRYPEDKTDITGIMYEPWHFRYVGVEAAKEIMSAGICLEEYLA
jgi:D-alanyl-D-alanine carboxypeptidase